MMKIKTQLSGFISKPAFLNVPMGSVADGVRLLLLMLSAKAFANDKSLDNVNNESLTPPRNANTES
ncbi:hypothetical protein SAMN02746065_10369 [Desulfocicer vacuolatum DSM 3385]|uniref:Uncharacterized protein n=1 Tax=Desulfocicer vacuolatum DSM 3385 TaxID=1121400 RepID=A0A1W1ZNI1_9BACT|nr:hypothetical protein [Desulfocicer vacuolatum]SMC50095.1 hypothetical protein SAMN02746065_10369 [Desulfocicer vacuolatum DSM 3385]